MKIMLTIVLFVSLFTTLVHPELGVKPIGPISGDTTINGAFSQSGASVPMVVQKSKRPQEPKPPFNYTVVHVKFNNKSDNITLSGTMTYPAIGTKFPAVVLISGSGPQNRDEELMGHKPFLLLADYLTKKGMAVLRYDDRGVGASKGNFQSATTADFTSDALSAVEYLRSQPNIDQSKMGVIGHSEGGTIAFMAAAQDHSLHFIVSMAGMAVKGSDLLLKQNDAMLALEGVSEEHRTLYVGVLSKVFQMVNKNSDAEIIANMGVISDTLFSKEELTLPEPMRKNSLLILNHCVTNPWMRYFLNITPVDAIRKMGSTRVLALHGLKDFQVDATMNLEAIKQNSKSKNSYRTYKNLNHLFQNCTTGNADEYARIEETISEQVLQDMADWILCK